MDISVIICTHNPRPEYLRRVLDALAAQTLNKDEWELLLIDNANKVPLEESWGLSWHPRARHCREDELGLTPARLRGIRETCSDILVYVDDDNVLAPDFLQSARTLLLEHSHLGAIGAGIIKMEFAAQPPPELVPYLGYITSRRVSRDLWSTNTDDLTCVPWGAGLCVRRQVADSYQQLVESFNVTEIVDRRGDQLFGDGDTAFSWASASAGLGFGVFPALHLTHLISANRLTQKYFLRLAHDSQFSAGVLNYLRTGVLPWEHHHLVERWVRLLLHGIRRGFFPFRFKCAVLDGMDSARQFIVQRRLQPLDQSGNSSIKQL
jgi:glycosyltransferase involved in cell wall biosynthesis